MRNKIFLLVLVEFFLLSVFIGLAQEEKYEETIIDVRSSVKPKEVYLQKKEIVADKLVLFLRVRWNVMELKILEEGKTRIEYAYMERKMKLNLGVEMFDLTVGIEKQITDYLAANKDLILDKAKKVTFIEESLEIKKE